MAAVSSLSRTCSELNALVVKRGFNSVASKAQSNVAITPQRRLRSARKTFEASALPPVFLLPFQSSLTRSQRMRQCAASPHYQRARYPPSPTSSRAYSTAILNPRVDETGSAMTISISARASSRLAAIASQETPSTSTTPSTTPSPSPPPPPNTLLRITVESGGCHGFQYLMSLTNSASISASEDTVFEAADGTGARVVLDEPSLQLLKGSEVDFTEELIGSHFVVKGNPRAKSSCGCGTSFDVVEA